jgi:phage repressor protein C with HTH and peptisase S24 domain
MENIAMHIGTRIKKLMNAQGVTGKDMAAYCDVTPGAVSGWFATGRISKEKLVMVANKLGVSTDDLISGTDTHEDQKQAIELSDNPDYPAIRRVSLKAQAGVSGYAVDYMNDDGPPIVFRKDWYTLHGYRPEKMMALRVAGESMVPNLYAGDLIVINSLQTEPKDGIAFVCIYEGEVVVKRLVRDSGQWWLTSDNADQRRYPRKACDNSTQVVGEVVYRQTERI